MATGAHPLHTLPWVPTTAADVQLSWFQGEALAWRPDRGRLMRSGPYGPGTAGTRMMRAALPHGTVDVVAQRLSPESIAVLGYQLERYGAPSASTAWFASVHRYAAGLVRSGRVVASLTTPRTGGQHVWLAHWRLLADDVEAAGPLLAAMPPAVSVFEAVDPAVVLATIADALARSALSLGGWKPTLPRGRARALRMVANALSSFEPRFVVGAELHDDLTDLAVALHHIHQRADGVPVLGARLRLLLPQPLDHSDDVADDEPVDDLDVDEPDDDLDDERWPLTLEVVDLDDRGRWCTAHDIAEATPAAQSVARHPRFFEVLRSTAAQAAHHVVDTLPQLAGWQQSDSAFVDLATAAELLGAIDSLTAAGVGVVVPEGLTRARPTNRATAQPKGEGSGRFGAQALVHWQATVDGDDVDEAALARIAAGGANLLQTGGRWVQIDRADAQRALQQLQAHRRDHGELTPLELMALATAMQADAAGRPNRLAAHPHDTLEGTGWVGELLHGLPDEALTEGAEPAGFTATLRPYQRRGLGWLQFLRRLGLGGCLADDMGLGKTPTTLAHLAGLPGPHLVVCPLSVVRNWQSEAQRFAPHLRVLVHHGGGRHGADTLADAVDVHDLVITTYQVATRDVAHLSAVAWSTVVLDEAQAVKNPDTHTARAMRKLPAAQRIALTGTPVENRLTELWSILHTVAPGLLGSHADFRRRFATPIERSRDAEAAERLRALTAPFLLRRTKADKTLVPDLPDKIEQIAWATLTPEQAHLYQQVVDQLLADAQAATGMRRRGLVLAALTRLKQICNHPAHVLADGSRLAGRSGKLNRFDELVTDFTDAGEPALVFTQFREMGLLLQQHLRDQFHLTVPFLHGGVSKAQRDRMVDRFQAGAGAPLLLVSLKAGGTGLNLTAASRVVHYDRWWNPAVEDQATDRAWRIGQHNSVFVHKLVCTGTIEEKVDQLINDKRALANAVVGTTGEAWLSELSTDQLRDLVVLDRSAAGE